MIRFVWQRWFTVKKDSRKSVKSADGRRSTFKPRLELLEDRLVMSNFGNLANALGSQLGAIDNAIGSLIGSSGATLPVLNLPIKDPSLAGIGGAISSFQGDLTGALSNIADNAADQVAQTAIDTALAGIEKGPSTVHVKLPADLNSTPEIDVKLHLGKTLINLQSPTFGIGLGSLPFKAQGSVGINVAFDLPDVDLGLDSNGGFFVNFNHLLDLTISAGLTNANLTGELGFLTFNASTTPGVTTGFNGTLSFDLLPANQPGVIVTPPKLTGSATVDLMLNAGFTGALVSAPSISSEFVVDWKFADSQVGKSDDTFGSDLSVKFKDVQVSLGSYLTQFLSPVITKVQQFTSPFKQFFEALGAPIPVLSDLAKVVGYNKGVSILDLAGIANSQGLIPPEYSALVTIGKEVVKITNVINQIEQQVGPGGLDNAKINIGDIDVVGSQSTDLRDIESAADKFGNDSEPDWSNLQNIASSVNVQPIKDQINKLLKGSGVGQTIADGLNDALDALQTSINNIADNNASLDLSFPFYYNPVPAVFGLLIGKDTNFVSFTAKAHLDAANSIPVFNYDGFEVDVTSSLSADAFLNLGYDSKGLRDFVASAFNDPTPDPTLLLDGFNLDPNSHLTISGSIGIKGGVNFTLLQAFAEGHLDADIAVDLPKDASGFAVADADHDGRIRGAEFLNPHLMEIKGDLKGGLDLDFVEGVKPLALEQKINLADGTIASFDIGYTNPFLPPPSVALASVDPNTGVMTLNIGPNAGARNLPVDVPAPVNENYLITGDPNNPTTVSVSALGFTQTYKGVKKIYAVSGTGDDTIVVDASVAAAVELHGGAGAESYSALGTGNAELWGGLVSNGMGHNALTGGKGASILHAGGGDDELHAGAGNATLYGGAGNDRLYGGAGTNHLFGGQGNDLLYGGTGQNFIVGGQGNDVLVAGPLNDMLTGGKGDNLFIAGAGHDIMTGGLGNNQFVWKLKDPTNNAPVSDGSLDVIGGGVSNTLSVYGGPKNDVFTIGKTVDPQFPVKIFAPSDAGGLVFTPIRVRDVENFDIEGRAGADTVIVNDLTNERIVNVGVNLDDLVKSNFGLADGVVDHVIVNGTQGDDNVTVNAATVQVQVPTSTVGQGILGGITTFAGIPFYKVSVANIQDDLLFNALNGNDIVNVLGISGPTRINGNGNLIPSGADNDVFNVTAKTSKDFATQLNIDANGGSNALHVMEPTSTGDQFLLTSNRIASGLLPGVNFKATCGTFGGGVSLTTGTNNDIVAVQSTMPGVTTSIDTGAGNDQVIVSSAGTLTGIQGPLAIELGAGNGNSLQLDNSNGTTGNQTASILANTVTGFAGSSGASNIIFHATAGAMTLEVDGSKKVALPDHIIVSKPAATFNLKTGAGNDAVDVTGLTNSATVNTGTGNDTVNAGAAFGNLNNLQALLTVNGGGGASVLNIYDTNAPAAEIYGLGASAFVRAGSSPIVFDNSLKALNIHLGNLNDQLSLFTAPVAGATTITGGNGQNTFVGPNNDTTWQIVGNNAGAIGTKLTFSKFQNLQGGSGADNFVVKNGQGITGKLDGGAGANTLDYSPYTTSVTVNLQTMTATHVGSFANVQTFSGGAGSDTLIGTSTPNIFLINGVNSGQVSTISLGNFTFKSFENLTGGASVDVFQFDIAGRLIGNVNGMAGANYLDYSLFTTAMPVVVNLKAGTATRIGGTLASVENVNGGAGDDIIIGDDNGDVLEAGSGNTILIGGAGKDALIAGSGNDILIGGVGGDTLTGGTGDDILIAGTTSFGTNLTPVQAIMSEWKSGDSFAVRRQHLLGTLPGGLNGTAFLKDATVLLDPSTDTVNAGAGNDWFWALNNEIINGKPGDKIGSQP